MRLQSNGSCHRGSTSGGSRAQTTIGTLIVFIAVLLVAALTAAVLFETAGMLQSETAASGDRSATLLSEQLDIVAITGNDITTQDGEREIRRIRVIVAGGGGEPLALGNVSAEWTGPRDVHFLVSEFAAEATTQPSFELEALSDPDGTFPVLTSSDDRYALTFRPGVDFGARGLQEGERASISLTTQSGAATTVRLSVPDSLAGQSAVTL